MNYLKIKSIIFSGIFSGLLFYSAIAQDAREIVRRADERGRGKTSIAGITIRIERPTWNREMSMKAWTKGNSLSVILITAPIKDRGTVFLKRDKEVWNYLPTIERNVKLPPSMMNQSWMGTDFTNDDLVKEASVVEDYNHSIEGDSVIEGRSCYKILLIPKPEAAVVWGKILLWIDKKDLLMLHAEYYDEEGTLVNTMSASDVKMLGGKLLPGRMEMVPAEKRGNKTILIYNSLEFDKPIDDDFFSTANMPKVR